MKNKFGYTLIELIIVVGIISLILPGVVSVLFSTIRSYTEVLIIQEVKRSGDNIIDILDNKIRSQVWGIYSDSAALNEVCTTRSGSTTDDESAPGILYFRAANGNIFFFVVNNGVLQFSDNGTLVDLTNNKVAVTSFALSCFRRSQYNPPLVSILFTVSQQGSPTRAEEKSTMTYSTKIKLRQY